MEPDRTYARAGERLGLHRFDEVIGRMEDVGDFDASLKEALPESLQPGEEGSIHAIVHVYWVKGYLQGRRDWWRSLLPWLK